MHRRGQHRRGCGFRGARLVVHAEVGQDLLRIGEHIHQVADRRALVTADIADPVFQQCLGDRQDALAVEDLPGAHLQFFDFACE